MTRKHYTRTAAILNWNYNTVSTTDDERRIVHSIAVDLADMFRDDNPRFDYRRFMDAVTIPAA